MGYTKQKLRCCGVYAIVHVQSGKQYIGSTARSFYERWKEHRTDLRGNKARNAYLQHAWNKYGEQAFEFIILEVCDTGMVVEREQFYIDNLNPVYNIAPNAGSNRGIKNPTTTARLRRQWQQPEYRERMAALSRNREPNRRLLSAKAKQRWQRPGFRERVSRALKGRVVSEKARAAMRQAWKTRAPASAESREKMRQGQTGRKHSMEARDKRARALSGGKVYTFVAPDGTMYHDVTNVSAFASVHGLNGRVLAALATGQRKQYRGWTAQNPARKELGR